MSNFWDTVWLILMTFVLVAYLLVLFQIIVDLFRDKNLGGFSKAIWFIGQFQGVIMPTTPIASCTTRALRSCSSHWNDLSARAAALKWPSPVGAWAARAKLIGAPISSLIAAATSAMRSL